MSTVEKFLEKMRNNPSNWRIEQLEIIAKRYGINIRKSGGSHVVFEHAEWTQLLCVPAHRPVKPIYVKKLIVLIDALEISYEKNRVFLTTHLKCVIYRKKMVVAI